MNDERALPMASRHVRLRPPTPPFLAEIYDHACRGEIPWVWTGGQLSSHEFVVALDRDNLVQFAIEDRRTSRAVGLVSAYDWDAFNGTAYVRFVLLPAFRLKVWPFEGAVLFANYMFTKFNLRKLCGRSVDDNFEHLRSGIGRFFDIEGCLKNHYVIDGRWQDMHLGALSRARWNELGLPLLRRLTV